jgi:hypothetical protein
MRVPDAAKSLQRLVLALLGYKPVPPIECKDWLGLENLS